MDTLVGTDGDSLIIPKSVVTIGVEAFYDCDGIIGVIFENGSSISSIGARAFYAADAMVSVLCESAAPNEVFPTIDVNAFSECDVLESFIMNNITSVHKDGVFENSKKISVLKMPALTTVSRSIIDQCTALTVVDLSSVTSIETNMFKDLAKLETVDISSVVAIPDNAFIGCVKLASVDASAVTSTPSTCVERPLMR